jgi:hypothetical protein
MDHAQNPDNRVIDCIHRDVRRVMNDEFSGSRNPPEPSAQRKSHQLSLNRRDLLVVRDSGREIVWRNVIEDSIAVTTCIS